jgi:hypothetical protein
LKLKQELIVQHEVARVCLNQVCFTNGFPATFAAVLSFRSALTHGEYQQLHGNIRKLAIPTNYKSILAGLDFQ